MNKIFFFIYISIIGVLLTLFFFDPKYIFNKYLVLVIMIIGLLILAFIFDRQIYDKVEYFKKLKVERGIKLFSMKMIYYVGVVSLAVILFIMLVSSGALQVFFKEEGKSVTNVHGTQVQCYDSDVEDYTFKGYAQLTVGEIPMPKENDACLDRTTLLERVCNSGKIIVKDVLCTSVNLDFYCDDGRCLLKPAENTNPLENATNISGNISDGNLSNATELINSTISNSTNQSFANQTLNLTQVNATPEEISTNFWNKTIIYLANETGDYSVNQKYSNVTIVSSGAPIIRNLKARPDSFNDYGMIDDDPQIFITWDLITTRDTKCYGELGDKNTLREVGIDGLDLDDGLPGYNRYFLKCCNRYGCGFAETDMKIVIS